MLLPQLRSRTAALHERVERAVGVSERLQSRGAYTALLARYYGFYRPLEARLAGVDGYAAVGIDFGSRRKAPLLRDDLRALGYSTEAIEGLPDCPTLPAPNGLAAALGCLYVLEGATLGGQIVRKEIKRAHGLEAGHGCSFFSSYGDNVGPMWREFCAALEDYARLHPGTEGAVTDAAVATFTAFEGWFSK